MEAILAPTGAGTHPVDINDDFKVMGEEMEVHQTAEVGAEEMPESASAADASTPIKAEPAASLAKAVKAAHCWNASDDLLLKDSLQVIHDFERIAKSIKFSVKVTAKDLEERWRQMLYDPKVAQEAAEGMSSVSAQTKRMLWGDEEESVLRREVAAPGFTNYQSVLENNRAVFHSSRTPKSLEAHFYRMKRVGTIAPAPAPAAALPPADNSIDAADAADKEDAETARLAGQSFVDMEAEAARDLPASDGVVHFDRMHKRILMAEKEHEHDRADREPTKGALALLRGLRVRYPMRTREILIGRDTPESKVDLNVLEEDPVEGMRASRRHALLRLKSDGDFHLKVLGRRPVFVNGQPLLPGKKRRLPDNSVLEIAGVKYFFEPNKILQSKIKRQLAQP